MSSRNNMCLDYRTAKRTFVAKCGHKIMKGEEYFVFDDYFGYQRYHQSECMNCHRNGNKETPKIEYNGIPLCAECERESTCPLRGKEP